MAEIAFDVDPYSADATSQQINVIPMNFRTDYRAPRKGEKKPREIDMVDLVKKGTNGESTTMRISEVQQDQMLWGYVEPYYNRWKEGEEEIVDGTPIEMLTFLGAGVVSHLKAMNVRSAEDFCEMNDASLDRLGMGARRWQERAKAYLETRTDVKVAEELSELREMTKLLAEENEDLRKQVNSLSKAKK